MELTIETASQNIDKALATLNVNREAHFILINSLNLLLSKAKEAEGLKVKVEELETLLKAK